MDWPLILGIAAAVSIALAIAARLHYLFWVRRFTIPADYAERFDLRMDDGVPITLYRLEPPPTPDRPPVLLVHGLAANHRNVDAAPDRSLARCIQSLGRDVWLLTLRSGQSGLTMRERARCGFAPMVEQDLPKAIAFVLERTKAERLDYIGFSMGGMLMYAALGRTVSPDLIGRAAFIGSPARVAPPLRFLRIFRFLPRFVFRGVWLRLLARMGAFLVELVRTPFHRHIYNPKNVDRGATARALVNLIEDVPAPLSADFAGWALSDGIPRVDGDDILAELGPVKLPAIFFAGADDRIAAADAVRAAFDAWGGDLDADAQDKRWVLLGTAEGAMGDYGHGDLAIGEHLAEDLFAPLSAFLDAPA